MYVVLELNSRSLDLFTWALTLERRSRIEEERVR
jgi:hypothetical protein